MGNQTGHCPQCGIEQSDNSTCAQCQRLLDDLKKSPDKDNK